MAEKKDIPTYLITGDKEELDRLNYQHKLLGETFGGLYRSPFVISKNQRVLDIGCGTANWGIDLANAHPDIQVLGFDIKDAPEWKTAPANCKLWVADLHAEDTWRQFEAKFDYIHGRMVTPAVNDWPTLIRRCFDALSADGWVEFQDQILPPRCEDDIPVAASPFLRMGQYIAEGSVKMGLSIDAMDRLPDVLQQAGFSLPVKENYRMIAGAWPEDPREKQLGEMGLTNFKLLTFNLTKALMTRVYGWSEDKHKEFVEEVLSELEEGKHRLYWPLRVCFAQKSVSAGY